MRRRVLAGNWKMHGIRARLDEVEAIDAAAAGLELVLCLPAPLIPVAAAHVWHLAIGAQDCHAAPEGPHTGGISATMLADAGATWVIIGHSECRADGATDEEVAAKLAAAAPHLRPILCVGEYRRGEGAGAVERQLAASLPADMAADALAVAYEPVWAIGTGLTPAPEEIAAMHVRLRAVLAARLGDRAASVPILYGGSVSAGNAGAILAQEEVDGLLVGGASLRAETFLPIIGQFREREMRAS